MNLVSNAVKFTPELGEISISVEQIEATMLKIKVADNGIGIKPEDQGKLFKVFGSIKDEQQKINTKGIGLGLIISRLLV